MKQGLNVPRRLGRGFCKSTGVGLGLEVAEIVSLGLTGVDFGNPTSAVVDEKWPWNNCRHWAEFGKSANCCGGLGLNWAELVVLVGRVLANPRPAGTD